MVEESNLSKSVSVLNKINQLDEINKGLFDSIGRKYKKEVLQNKPNKQLEGFEAPVQPEQTKTDEPPLSKPETIEQTKAPAFHGPTAQPEKPKNIEVPKSPVEQQAVTSGPEIPEPFKNYIKFDKKNPIIDHINNRIIQGMKEGIKKKDPVTGEEKTIVLSSLDIEDARSILNKINFANNEEEALLKLIDLGRDALPISGESTGETMGNSTMYRMLKNSVYKHVDLTDGLKSAIANIFDKKSSLPGKQDEIDPYKKMIMETIKMSRAPTIKDLGITIGRNLLKSMPQPAAGDKKLTPKELEARRAILGYGALLRDSMGLNTYMSKSNFGSLSNTINLKRNLGVTDFSPEEVDYAASKGVKLNSSEFEKSLEEFEEYSFINETIIKTYLVIKRD